MLLTLTLASHGFWLLRGARLTRATTRIRPGVLGVPCQYRQESQSRWGLEAALCSAQCEGQLRLERAAARVVCHRIVCRRQAPARVGRCNRRPGAGDAAPEKARTRRPQARRAGL